MMRKVLTVVREGDGAESGRRGKLALLFPGQGSQHPGMGRRLYEASRAARRVFAAADDVVGFRLSRLCFDGPRDELDDTVNTQPAIVATSVAYLAYLGEKLQALKGRLSPSFLAGHSLGQFTAAVAAEALDLADGLRLVLERGRIMKDWARQRPGGLATLLGMDEEEASHICAEVSPEGEVGVAAHNAPGQTVIAGLRPALETAIELARRKGARVVQLPISVPGHIPIMRDVAAELGRTLSHVSFRDPQTPIVSNISARLLTTAEDVREELSDQLCTAVEWARCLLAMVNQGVASFVEVGPGGTLSRLARRISEGVDAYSLSEDEETALRLASPVALGAPP